MRRLAPIVITLVVGWIVLVSYILPTAVLPAFRLILINAAIIVASFALLMGFVHLLGVHWQRFRQRRSLFYSPILLLSALITFIVLIIDRWVLPDPIGLTTGQGTCRLRPEEHAVWAEASVI